jgi:hypothetical protein
LDNSSCRNNYSLVLVGGAYCASTSELILAAYGNSSIIYQNTTSTDNATNFDRGTYFYKLPDYSFGFSPNSSIGLSIADWSNLNDSLRLSWRLKTMSGFRIGNITHLDNSILYCKVTFGVNSSS